MFAVDTSTVDSQVDEYESSSGVGGLMHGIKIPQQDFALKRQGGGAYARGGAYLRDTTVIGVELGSRSLIQQVIT